MNQLCYEPMKMHDAVFTMLKDEAAAYFDRLVQESGVDVEQNRETVKKETAEVKQSGILGEKIRRLSGLRTFLIVLIVAGIAAAVYGGYGIFTGNASTARIVCLVLGILAAVIGLGVIYGKLNRDIAEANEKKDSHDKAAGEYRREAYEEVAPLNALYDDSETFKLIESVMPELDFDDYFSMERDDEINRRYDFADAMSDDRTVLNTLSGTLCKNPFLFVRYKEHRMGTETYEGSLTITWTEHWTDSEGESHSTTRTETLRATVTKPKPFYNVHNTLYYGNQAAPDLHFMRGPNSKINYDADDETLRKQIEDEEKRLYKKGRKAVREGGNFQEMANTEFEIMFNATNRDNEVQFRLMYTPLAQNNTVDLLRKWEGFYFKKDGRLNEITRFHPEWTMETSGNLYRSHSVDLSKKMFMTHNLSFFEYVYRDLAPLMCVPAYMEEPSFSLDPPDEYECNFPYYQHETMANAIGQERFAHPDSGTECILKTRIRAKEDGTDRVSVRADSYRCEDRTDYVRVHGGDGNYHDVPVHWVEYIPVTRDTDMTVTDTKMHEREFREKMSDKIDDPLQTAYLHRLFACIH